MKKKIYNRIVAKLKVKDLAEKFDVNRRVALGWFERGLFPSAKKVKGEFFYYWEVEESDIKDFIPQKRKGKPSKKSVEPAAED